MFVSPFSHWPTDLSAVRQLFVRSAIERRMASFRAGCSGLMDAVDVVITNGTIVDGTGGPARSGTVAVREGRLAILAPDAPLPAAARTIDATGRAVAPGFIDLHSHSGLVLFADGRHEPKVRQGVTTEVIGVDGLSYAPF
ncbi:MAG TPA: amidohydrolase family protein, partial [Candidatus Limnocylindrales bacterium]|nr:amidohydrolase family protein [Candidatus Limnocylindrales bacterium]